MSQHAPEAPEYIYFNSTLFLNWHQASVALNSFSRYPIDYFIQFSC